MRNIALASVFVHEKATTKKARKIKKKTTFFIDVTWAYTRTYLIWALIVVHVFPKSILKQIEFKSNTIFDTNNRSVFSVSIMFALLLCVSPLIVDFGWYFPSRFLFLCLNVIIDFGMHRERHQCVWLAINWTQYRSRLMDLNLCWKISAFICRIWSVMKHKYTYTDYLGNNSF